MSGEDAPDRASGAAGTARPVLVAPDSFKGTFHAPTVAAAMSAGLGRAGVAADECPVGDGGEGTVDVLLDAQGGSVTEVRVSGPLGRAVEARFAMLGAGETAAVEAAEAAGLGLVAPDERDPERATTRGVGELIAAARASGARTVLVAVGGTVTTDGGGGAVEAIRAASGLGDLELIVLCDVTTPFERAAVVYGPQKGADPEAVGRLTDRLNALAERYPRDPRGRPGTGAGGGLAGGLWAELGAELVPGAERVLELVGFRSRLASARSVLTGEGRLDRQTEEGKAIAEICRWARREGRRADAIVGRDDLPAPGRGRLGLSSVREASTPEEIQAAAAAVGEELKESSA